MERLTDDYKGRYGIKTQEGIMPAYEMALGKRTAAVTRDFQKGIDRLVDYENTGLMPEQIKEINRLYAEKCKELAECQKNCLTGIELANIAIGLKKLREYEDLEEQGKLLKLPCAVGDTVYVIPSETNYKLNIINGHSENNRVYEQVVNRIEISNTGYLLVTCDGMASVVDTFYKKTWFLTKEEAEAALKGL